MSDPFSRALRDHARDDRREPLYRRDGDDVAVHPIEAFYFADPTFEDPHFAWLADRVEGPVLDVGAGVGRLARWFQDDHETVALEVSDALVTAMAERGVADPRRGDLFSLPTRFPPDRFRTVLVIGTHLGLARSVTAVRELLVDLAAITDVSATLIVDSYDPTSEDAEDLLGYRADPRPGLAGREFRFEYEDDVGEPLRFGLYSPARLRQATDGTAWRVTAIQQRRTADHGYYRAALTKDVG